MCWQIVDVMDLGDDLPIDEFTFQSSLGIVLPENENDAHPKIFNEILKFINEVRVVLYFFFTSTVWISKIVFYFT